MRTEDCFGNNYHYIWSDNWYLDNDKAWFMAGSIDLLFCLDIKTKKTDLVDYIISDAKDPFRQHPRIIKIKNKIVCLPDTGKDVWVYHLDNQLWSNIMIKNPYNTRLFCHKAWFIKGRLYMVSLGLKQIIEIDLDKEEVTDYHNLAVNQSERLTDCILIDKYIYIIGFDSAYIYKFDCLNKSIQIFKLIDVDDQLCTICFDGRKFWMSGRCKKIYIWDEITNKIEIISKFPEEFGIWNFNGKYKQILNCKENLKDSPLFISSISVGDFIWFIPYQTNEILYVKKDTYEIKVFSLQNELQTQDNLDKQLLNTKYLLEYVRDGRYIGIFSLKNKWIFEIDSWKLDYKILDYSLNKALIEQIDRIIFNSVIRRYGIYGEQYSDDLRCLMEGFVSYNRDSIKKCNKMMTIGKQIYSIIEAQ